jgi:hypothetical protein
MPPAFVLVPSIIITHSDLLFVKIVHFRCNRLAVRTHQIVEGCILALPPFKQSSVYQSSKYCASYLPVEASVLKALRIRESVL